MNWKEYANNITIEGPRILNPEEVVRRIFKYNTNSSNFRE